MDLNIMPLPRGNGEKWRVTEVQKPCGHWIKRYAPPTGPLPPFESDCDCSLKAYRNETKQREVAYVRAHMENTRQKQSAIDSTKTFETFDLKVDPTIKAAYQLIRDFSEGYGRGNARGVILSGPSGLGKRHLVLAASQVLLRRGIRVRPFWSASYLDSQKAAMVLDPRLFDRNG